MNPLLVFTNCPDIASAETIALALIKAGLAACVSIQAPCRSVYEWQGTLESTEEIPLLIKTSAERYLELQDSLKALHPYSVPELIAVPITQGLPAYLDWLKTETCKESS